MNIETTRMDINNNEIFAAHHVPIKENSSSELGGAIQRTMLSATTLNTLVDKATGIVQNITKNSLTNDVIRKMPTDEYLKLLHSVQSSIDDLLNNTV